MAEFKWLMDNSTTAAMQSKGITPEQWRDRARAFAVHMNYHFPEHVTTQNPFKVRYGPCMPHV
jgi:hypothetical protein